MDTVNKRIVVATVALAGIAVVVLATVLSVRSRRTAPAGKEAHIAIAAGEEPPEPSVWIDVHDPAKLWRSLRVNPWVARAASEPTGQGLLSGWAGFLETKGSDLSGAFEGAVIDVVATKLLSDPFRVVFFAGREATGTPALVVPSPSSVARDAFRILDAAARNGTYETPRCPGAKESASTHPVAVSRWLLAGHAVFAGEREGRIALARNPRAVIQGLCAAPPDIPAARGVDVSLSFSSDALGREAQLAAALMGLGCTTRLAFALEKNRLEPRGLMGPLEDANRLGAVPPPESLLRLVPADAGVVLLAAIRVPEKLTRESLSQHLGGKYSGPLAARPVALVWNPRGDAALPTEVAVAWPERDAVLLREAFSGPNRMERRRACGHELYASTGALAKAMEQSCAARSASILNAAPAVVAGLKERSSIVLGIQVGSVLSRLMGDSYAADKDAKPHAPEMDAARRLVEELPFVGLRGVTKDGALVPGGFRS